MLLIQSNKLINLFYQLYNYLIKLALSVYLTISSLSNLSTILSFELLIYKYTYILYYFINIFYLF